VVAGKRTRLPERICFQRIPRSAAAKIFKDGVGEDTLPQISSKNPDTIIPTLRCIPISGKMAGPKSARKERHKSCEPW
jgi:hypothetical protein